MKTYLLRRATLAWSCLICCLVVAVVPPALAAPATRNSIIFIHHSIGRGLLYPLTGASRDSIAVWNARYGTQVRLWDHDYGPGHPVWGLSDPSGQNLGRAYGEEFNNTIQVSGYRALFCTANASLDSLLQNHQVIVFKPGYESGWLWLVNDAELDSAKADYLVMRDFFDQHPEKLFVIVTQPPIHRNADYLDARKDRARALANWLSSTDFLGLRTNVLTFDFFDLLATPDEATDPYSNTLRYEYELDHTNSDPHPNDLAHTTIGPLFARLIYGAALTKWPVGVPPAARRAALEPARPNPFNPRTELAWFQAAPGRTRLALHDVCGRLVCVLADGDFSAGRHVAAWDGRDRRGRAASSGVYLARLQTAGETLGRRLVLAR